jgi:uncharacterized protein YwgA
METATRGRDERQLAAELIAAAGGKLIGRTRLQKLAYLMQATGLSQEFYFEYRHFGPYSEDLALAVRDATWSGLISETEEPTSWGGFYSIYTTEAVEQDAARRDFAEVATQASSVVLELAATAAFLAKQGAANPWEETERRKPEKAAEGRLQRARELYQRLAAVSTPKALPQIP